MANAYQALVKSKASFCKGKTTKTAVKKKAAAYVRGAMKSGKTKAEARKSANRVLMSSCTTTTGIGKRKKKGAKRKSAKRK